MFKLTTTLHFQDAIKRFVKVAFLSVKMPDKYVVTCILSFSHHVFKMLLTSELTSEKSGLFCKELGH